MIFILKSQKNESKETENNVIIIPKSWFMVFSKNLKCGEIVNLKKEKYLAVNHLLFIKNSSFNDIIGKFATDKIKSLSFNDENENLYHVFKWKYNIYGTIIEFYCKILNEMKIEEFISMELCILDNSLEFGLDGNFKKQKIIKVIKKIVDDWLKNYF